jgi:D-arabinose 5-phosphate isomerase GutQ
MRSDPVPSEAPLDLRGVAWLLRQDFPELFGPLATTPRFEGDSSLAGFSLTEAIEQRLTAIHAQIGATLAAHSQAVERAAILLLQWMIQGKLVRIIGAGRARLAATIPANRLAHGGAQIYVQDGIVPMPHTIRSGGIIAVSASGKTEAVLSVLRSTRQFTRDVQVIGIAASGAHEFSSLCDVFIGIEPEPPTIRNPLRALADTEEYVISELLDGLVVGAGKLGGFDDSYWRLGHEDIGATGPYNFGEQREHD